MSEYMLDDHCHNHDHCCGYCPHDHIKKHKDSKHENCLFCRCTNFQKLGEVDQDEKVEYSYADQEEWKKFIGYYSALRLPIDVKTDLIKDNVKKLSYSFSYSQHTKGVIVVNSHSRYFIPYGKDSYIDFSDEYSKERYFLEQFHFHTFAENRVDGLIAPMELHLVHRSESNNFLVLGLLLDITNKENKALPFTIDLFNHLNDETITLDLSYLNKLQNTKTFCFHGSLTSPPFLPNDIKWLLIPYTETKKRLAILDKDFNIFNTEFINNKANELSFYQDNRYAEPLNYLSVYNVENVHSC